MSYDGRLIDRLTEMVVRAEMRAEEELEPEEPIDYRDTSERANDEIIATNLGMR